MENWSEEDNNNCLEDNLEARKEKMAQYMQEMRYICQQIAQFPSEVKKVIDMHFSRGIISQLTYKLYADSIVFTKDIVFYSYMNTQYLLGENYDDIYDVWNNYRENVSKTIKTTQNLIDTNFFQESNFEDPKWHGIEEHVYWSSISFSKLKSEHELSVTNGNGLLQVLSHALLAVMELLDKLKAGYLYIEEKEFDNIYEANYLLYKRDYWPKEGGNFRQNVETNYLHNSGNRIEDLRRLLWQEKSDFVHSAVGVIWRDFFSDKKELYKRMKNDGIDEEQWKYFFQHICRFEEFEKWIDELEHPLVEEKEYPESIWDKIFKDTIDVKKVKAALPGLLPDKPSIPNWYVVHKILEEINWLQDVIDTHFISWVKDVYGWDFQTTHFKSVNSALKKAHSLDWNVRTMTAANVVEDHMALANKIRSEFVKKMEGKTVKEDNTYYFKKPDLYIAHE